MGGVGPGVKEQEADYLSAIRFYIKAGRCRLTPI
jgi:hypothetical protein